MKQINGGKPLSFPIEDDKTVFDLQLTIKRLNRIKYPADELTFYLATRNGKWLQRWDPDVQQVLKRGPMSDTFMELLSDDKIMDPQRPLSDFNLCERQDIWNNEFHVLLELPKGKHYRNRMARRKKERAEQRRKEHVKYLLAKNQNSSSSYLPKVVTCALCIALPASFQYLPTCTHPHEALLYRRVCVAAGTTSRRLLQPSR
ncbi:hypothetical protein GN244_ATG06975 [Phytophthora infestans]|uniref:Crinkler (CRN) family protein n=1 Tax=Phytophthora infestans TaxID=4787 RepID=A0A833S5C6_PHYIN|nr:hypothetical protein GN244_ATG06975 [Phytophthora infestans]